MSEQLIGWLEAGVVGGLVFELEPACPCGRAHPFLYADLACDAALRRQRVVESSAIDTSRAIAERVQRERAERVDDALGSRSCHPQRKRATARRPRSR